LSGIAFTVTVEGTPITQGSKNRSATGHTYDDNAKTLKPWRRRVTAAAAAALPRPWTPLDGPLRVSVAFAFERPKSHPKRTRTWPTHNKDIDKLQRAVLDSLTEAGVWADDGRVVDVHARKDWCGPDIGLALPGVLIEVSRIEPGVAL
jgi:crossover junction endodeoxyribonuclease RusA